MVKPSPLHILSYPILLILRKVSEMGTLLKVGVIYFLEFQGEISILVSTLPNGLPKENMYV